VEPPKNELDGCVSASVLHEPSAGTRLVATAISVAAVATGSVHHRARRKLPAAFTA